MRIHDQHPGWSDERVADEYGIHRFDMDIVGTASRDFAAEGGLPEPWPHHQLSGPI